MATSWYLRQAGKVVGPYSSSQLKQMADAALITPQAEVSQAESGPWSAARKVKGLFPDAVPSASAYDDKPPPPTTSHLEKGERRGRIKEYFNAMGSGCAVVLLLIAACLGYLSLYAYGNAARLEMGLAVFCVLGAGGIFMAMKRVPSDSDMDSWLDDDLRNVTALSLGKVGLRRDSIIQDPAVVTGPTVWKIEGVTRLSKQGKDGVLRFTPVSVTIINFTKDQLVGYTCVLDRLTGKLHAESTEEFFYRDIVAVAMKRESKKVSLDGKDVQLNAADTFTVTTSGGNSLAVFLADPDLTKQMGGGRIPTDRIERAIEVVRNVVRERK
jgi:hypothetical protein